MVKFGRKGGGGGKENRLPLSVIHCGLCLRDENSTGTKYEEFIYRIGFFHRAPRAFITYMHQIQTVSSFLREMAFDEPSPLTLSLTLLTEDLNYCSLLQRLRLASLSIIQFNFKSSSLTSKQL